ARQPSPLLPLQSLRRGGSHPLLPGIRPGRDRRQERNLRPGGNRARLQELPVLRGGALEKDGDAYQPVVVRQERQVRRRRGQRGPRVALGSVEIPSAPSPPADGPLGRTLCPSSGTHPTA